MFTLTGALKQAKTTHQNLVEQDQQHQYRQTCLEDVGKSLIKSDESIKLNLQDQGEIKTRLKQDDTLQKALQEQEKALKEIIRHHDDAEYLSELIFYIRIINLLSI